jgi:hypothetical protein
MIDEDLADLDITFIRFSSDSFSLSLSDHLHVTSRHVLGYSSAAVELKNTHKSHTYWQIIRMFEL